MNANTENRIDNMKNQTIGVEVEMNGIRRQKAAKIAAEFFGTGRWQDTARRNGYAAYSAWDAQGREWKFQRDSSIHGPDGEKCEMVTPILTYADIETLQELCRRLRKAGAKSDASRGCGVHIHIGADGHTPKTLRNLANIMASHESLLVLPHGQPELPAGTERQEARHDGEARRHLVQQPRPELGPRPALQQKPLPYAQPSRDLHQGHD